MKNKIELKDAQRSYFRLACLKFEEFPRFWEAECLTQPCCKPPLRMLSLQYEKKEEAEKKREIRYLPIGRRSATAYGGPVTTIETLRS